MGIFMKNSSGALKKCSGVFTIINDNGTLKLKRVTKGFKVISDTSGTKSLKLWYQYNTFDGTIYKVTSSGSGTKDGSTWDNAMDRDTFFAKTQALYNTPLTTKTQFWLKAGDYTWSENGTTTGIALTKNVSIFGGFAGTESSLSQRQRSSNGYSKIGNTYSSSRYNTVKSGYNLYGFDNVIDGMEFVGSVIIYDFTDMTINDCKFSLKTYQKLSLYHDSSVYNVIPQANWPTSAVLNITNCIFTTGNSYALSMDPTSSPVPFVVNVEDCEFDNLNTGSIPVINVYNSSSTSISNQYTCKCKRCKFNLDADGGTTHYQKIIYLRWYTKVELENCRFVRNLSDNASDSYGTDPILYPEANSSLTLTGCTFEGIRAKYDIAPMFNVKVYMYNCISTYDAAWFVAKSITHHFADYNGTDIKSTTSYYHFTELSGNSIAEWA